MDYRNNFLFSEAFIQDAFKKVEKNGLSHIFCVMQGCGRSPAG